MLDDEDEGCKEENLWGGMRIFIVRDSSADVCEIKVVYGISVENAVSMRKECVYRDIVNISE